MLGRITWSKRPRLGDEKLYCPQRPWGSLLVTHTFRAGSLASLYWPNFYYVSNEPNSWCPSAEKGVTVGRWQRCHLGRRAGPLTKRERWLDQWLRLVNWLVSSPLGPRHDLWLPSLRSALHPFSDTLCFPACQYIKNQLPVDFECVDKRKCFKSYPHTDLHVHNL